MYRVAQIEATFFPHSFVNSKKSQWSPLVVIKAPMMAASKLRWKKIMKPHSDSFDSISQIVYFYGIIFFFGFFPYQFLLVMILEDEYKKCAKYMEQN